MRGLRYPRCVRAAQQAPMPTHTKPPFGKSCGEAAGCIRAWATRAQMSLRGTGDYAMWRNGVSVFAPLIPPQCAEFLRIP